MAGSLGCLEAPTYEGLACDEARPCPQGSACIDGTCRRPCTRNADCFFGESCSAGSCVADVSSAEQDAGNAPLDAGEPAPDAAVVVECMSPSDCTSPGACTVAAGATCDDGTCRYPEVECTTPPEPQCVDGDAIFRRWGAGACNPSTGTCEYTSIDQACANCTVTCLEPCAQLTCPEQSGGCLTNGLCQPGAPGTPATCAYEEASIGKACTQPSGAAGFCSAGDCVECTDETHCDDGDPCTVDACSPTGTCQWTPGTGSAEVCDGADNDCNGLPDDDLVQSCSSACGTGVETCVAGAWQGCTAPLCESITLAGESADGYEDIYGPHLQYDWMSLYSSAAWAATRFTVPNVPQGATILDAWLELYVDSDDIAQPPEGEDDPRLAIYVEDTASPAPLSGVTDDIANRGRWSTRVDWFADDVGTGFVSTPSLAVLVQHIVDKPTWTPGSSILFIYNQQVPGNAGDPALEFRQWDFWNTSANSGAVLHISYE